MSLVVCVRAKCLKKSNVKTDFQNFLQTLNKTNPKHERQKKEEKTRSGLSSKTTGVCVCARARADRDDAHKKKSESTRERRQKQHTTFGSVVAFDDETRRRRSSFFFAEERRHHHERGDIVVESVCQSRPVAKTPSAHADVQTHVPGVLFRRGHVRNLLRLREGEREEEDRALIIY